MKVNYSPRLINLISEVRHFKALGYHVPSHIDQTSEHAKKFMKLARTLEQVLFYYFFGKSTLLKFFRLQIFITQ